ncbi:MAG TPA: NADH-quinone oxidoreductase subunit L [Fibrobacteria bacterium]|nr:NADH-quinone oxidoreductase subunit L [Fibrobacteria bacterium]
MASPLFLLLIPLLPGLSAAVLALLGRRLPYNAIGAAATAAVAASFALTLTFLGAGILGTDRAVDFAAGPWIETEAFRAGLALRLDSVSLMMCLLVTFFGTVITLYSVGYMRHDQEQGRFFASLNLFVASMLVLVLSDNLVLIFLGWEGVGLCSYLLIGHYWEQKDVPLAAYRAFFVNRIGDVLFILGVFQVYNVFGTVSLSELSSHGPGLADIHQGKAALAALLLLGGAFAKSAQVPLHVWLADAMAGPTPVSALIHAATMVTAGIYLVGRLDWLYAVSPEARFVVGVCSFLTLVLGVFMALSQTDIKKILAYSTLSNLGLMFLALSVGATDAAMGHLFGHAFFKALLFLAAGSVIFAAHHEQEVGNLKGVLRKLPVTNVAFLVGCVGGAGLLPYLAAGFFTKEAVLDALHHGNLSGWGITVPGSLLFWGVVAVETLSAVYLFRLYGWLRSDSTEPKFPKAEHAHHPHKDHHGHGGEIKEKSPTIVAVLGILALAAPIFGILSAPPSFPFSSGRLHAALTNGGAAEGGVTLGHAAPLVLVSILLAAATYLVYSNTRRREAFRKRVGALSLGAMGPLARKFYFDDLYAAVIVAPLKGAAWLGRLLFEGLFTGILNVAGWLGQLLSTLIRRLQTGKANQYAMGVLLATFILVFLLAGR